MKLFTLTVDYTIGPAIAQVRRVNGGFVRGEDNEIQHLVRSWQNQSGREGRFEMYVKSGRLEMRQRVAVPVTISSIGGPVRTDQTKTENLSLKGIRVLTWHERKKEEIVVVELLITEQRILARVVYCQRLSDGRFAIGLEFKGAPVHFPEESMAAASD